MYFHLNLGVAKNELDDCECSEPCQTRAFNPSLSFSAISSLSIEKLLSSGERKILTKKYHGTMDTRQRIRKEIFSEQLQKLFKISDLYNKFYNSLMMTSSDDAIVAVKTVMDFFSEDLKAVRERRGHLAEFYKTVLANFDSILTSTLSETRQMIMQLLLSSTFADTSSEGKRLIFEVISNVNKSLAASIAVTQIFREDLLKPPVDTSSLVFPKCNAPCSVEEKPHYSVRPQSKQELCQKKVDEFLTALKAVRNSLPVNENSSLDVTELQRVTSLNAMTENITHFCMTDFSVSLNNHQLWSTKYNEIDARFQPMRNAFNLTQKSQNMVADIKSVKHLHGNYSLGLMNMSHIAQEYTQGVVNDLITNVDDLLKAYERDVSSRLEAVKKIRDTMMSGYVAMLKYGATIETYYDYSAERKGPAAAWRDAMRKMSIWQGLVANMDNPSVVSRESDNVERLWRKTWGTDEFMAKYRGEDKAIAAIKAYFKPIIESFDDTGSDIRALKEQIATALNDLLKVVRQFKEKMVIDENFIE